MFRTLSSRNKNGTLQRSRKKNEQCLARVQKEKRGKNQTGLENRSGEKLYPDVFRFPSMMEEYRRKGNKLRGERGNV